MGSGIEVAAVVTNPDRPAGRGMKLRPSPVKERALEHGLEILQPERARDPQLHARLRALGPDVATVVAYGSILPTSLLEIPPQGFVNLHFSLLPLYRGAAPVQRALLEGRDETGVSIMVLTQGMDEGPVLARRATAVGEDETAGTLGDRLADIGARLLAETLPRYVAGELDPEPQSDAEATYAPKVTSDEARIDWNQPAQAIRAHVRGLNPAPGAWSILDDARLKLWTVVPATASLLSPGEIEGGERLLVGTATSSLEIIEAQLQGKKRMSGTELARGLRLPPGARLG